MFDSIYRWGGLRYRECISKLWHRTNYRFDLLLMRDHNFIEKRDRIFIKWLIHRLGWFSLGFVLFCRSWWYSGSTFSASRIHRTCCCSSHRDPSIARVCKEWANFLSGLPFNVMAEIKIKIPLKLSQIHESYRNRNHPNFTFGLFPIYHLKISSQKVQSMQVGN